MDGSQSSERQNAGVFIATGREGNSDSSVSPSSADPSKKHVVESREGVGGKRRNRCIDERFDWALQNRRSFQALSQVLKGVR